MIVCIYFFLMEFLFRIKTIFDEFCHFFVKNEFIHSKYKKVYKISYFVYIYSLLDKRKRVFSAKIRTPRWFLATHVFIRILALLSLNNSAAKIYSNTRVWLMNSFHYWLQIGTKKNSSAFLGGKKIPFFACEQAHLWLLQGTTCFWQKSNKFCPSMGWN